MVADHKGRKPVIIISCILVAVSSLAFGFSVNFAMAIISRFLIGFLNGKPNLTFMGRLLPYSENLGIVPVLYYRNFVYNESSYF